jgi:hypothetical protein
MKITNEVLAHYAGGQLERQCSGEPVTRGEVERAWIEGEEDNQYLYVTYKWLAEATEDFDWLAVTDEERLRYFASLMVTSFNVISDDRLAFSVAFVGERGVFFPPGGSTLEPERVKGLVLQKA